MITILHAGCGRLPICSEFVVSQKVRDFPDLSFECQQEKAHERTAAPAISIKGRRDDRPDAFPAAGHRTALAIGRAAGCRD